MITLIFGLLLIAGCEHRTREQVAADPAADVSLVVLGTIQDGGSPHIGCRKDCCKALFDNPDPERKVTSLGLVSRPEYSVWMFDATPDLTSQLHYLITKLDTNAVSCLKGIFLTHAHIGHYTGLMYLGREAIGAKQVPVYTMPRMQRFLNENGPWSQLVALNNIALNAIVANVPVKLSPGISVTPFLVPHRDEFSETVGYVIAGPRKKALYIPDIDKWQKWDRNIREEIAKVDYAFIDGTFFSGEEINSRDISEIPHPFVGESLVYFADLPAEERKKIFFIHFNHSNPLLDGSSEAVKAVKDAGMNVAEWGMEVGM